MGIRRWRLLLSALRGAREPYGEEVRKIRAGFAAHYREVVEACLALTPAMAEAPVPLAEAYMTAIMRGEHGEGWWTENAPYLTEPWFIWRWASETGHVSIGAGPASPSYRVIRPAEGGEHTACLRLQRQWGRPEEGLLHLTLPEALEDTIQRMGFRRKETDWVRHVGEMAAPLVDRAVETAVALLRAGCAVSVSEPCLVPLIREERYAPMHRYWVMASAQIDRLRVVFPRDQQLYRYVHAAGGRWNGRVMEIPIACADRLEELMRLYGFRATRKAEERLRAWHEAVRETVIYRERQGKLRKAVPTEDRFRQMMERPAAVPADLRDDD